jgi:hypothetical protein
MDDSTTSLVPRLRRSIMSSASKKVRLAKGLWRIRRFHVAHRTSEGIHSQSEGAPQKANIRAGIPGYAQEGRH